MIKEKILNRIEELYKEIALLEDSFYGREYSYLLEDEVEFLNELLKEL